MKKFWKYALVAMLAVAMLFSFASCDDDDDDDDDDVSLSDAEIVNIVAAAFVDAITTNYATDDSGSTKSDYSSWDLDSSYTLTISTTSEYTGYVDSSYSVMTKDSTDAYTVTVSSGSSVIVYLGYLYEGYNGPVYVTIDATVDGADENLALTAYLNSSMSVLGSTDSTDETNYTPSLTINGEASSLSESAIASLVDNLIGNVMTAMNSSSDSSAAS